MQHLLKRIIPFFFLFYAQSGFTQSIADNSSFTVENYYKVKWGYAEEFISLWTKNHYPLLKKAKEKGDIINVVAEKPRLHSSEDANLTTPYKKSLYPDLEKLAKDELHRFELLIAHWDVMTERIPLE